MNYIDETIKILNNYKNLIVAEKNLTDEIETIKLKLQHKSINYESIRSKSSLELDDRLCNLIYKRDKIKKLLYENKKIINKLNVILNNLDFQYKDILINSYVENKADTKIAKDLKISRVTLYEKRKKALKQLAIQLFGISAL